MPPRKPAEDEFDDDEASSSELHDWEYPEPDDEDDDENVTVRCSACGASVYEFAEHCPHCGELLTHNTRPWSGRSWVWMILGIAGILAVILVILRDHGLLGF